MSRHLSRETVIKPLAIHADADEAYKLNHAPKFKNAEQYIKAKLKNACERLLYLSNGNGNRAFEWTCNGKRN